MALPNPSAAQHIRDLMNKQADWPEFTRDADGRLGFTVKQIAVRDILGLSQDSQSKRLPLMTLFDKKMEVLIAWRNSQMRRFKEKEPLADTSELEKYWNGHYPRKEALEAKRDEFDKEWVDHSSLEHREIESIDRQLESLPPKEKVMLNLVNKLHINQPEHKADVLGAILLEIAIERTLDDAHMIHTIGRRVNTLQKLLSNRAPERTISDQMKVIVAAYKNIKPVMEKIDHFSFDDSLGQVMPGLDIRNVKQLSDSIKKQLRTAKDAAQVAAGTIGEFITNVENILKLPEQGIGRA